MWKSVLMICTTMVCNLRNVVDKFKKVIKGLIFTTFPHKSTLYVCKNVENLSIFRIYIRCDISYQV